MVAALNERATCTLSSLQYFHFQTSSRLKDFEKTSELGEVEDRSEPPWPPHFAFPSCLCFVLVIGPPSHISEAM